jgi:SAM-dependent methyltransferase
MRRQLLALYVSIGAGVAGVVAFALVRPLIALLVVAAAVVAWKLAVAWQRADPIPMPASLRWAMYIPRGHSPRKLARILAPVAGERVLEVGPGPGIHALAVAAELTPGGTLEVLDIQEEMLDALRRRATKAGISNIVATQGDARSLPYADGSFDAAFIIAALGEMPDPLATLRELRRVLKAAGRLVVAEVIVDPDFVAIDALERHAAEAGFSLERTSGPTISYFARFRPAPAAALGAQ